MERFPFANDMTKTIPLQSHPYTNPRNPIFSSMGDEHLDTIPATESDEVIKSSVEDLVPILSESEGIPDKMCDVPLCENTTLLKALNEHSETIIDYNDDSTSSDDDSYENIDYVDASSTDIEIVSLEVVGIVDPEVERINDDILLTIKDDILREKLKTNTFDKFYFPEISKLFALIWNRLVVAGPDYSPELSLSDIKPFSTDNDHFKEKSSGSTITHVDFSQYDSFIFDLSNDQFPPADRSDLNHEEFADELTHIMSLPKLEYFKFKIEPDQGDLTSIDPGIRKNVSTTKVNVPLEDDQSSLFAYVVWIFLAFLTLSSVCPLSYCLLHQE
ncbi:hypothetical protein Tco_0895005 [Tanacetum coccineum]|uniref:Uncharacterized protein n=1 Tax=Tanacetum coccineum TaxID=301880 RepID=A0ABQ5CFZ5_9ASTR